MQQRLQQGGFTLVTALALLSGCIAQNPLGVTFTEGGKGAGIASGLVEKTATSTTPASISSILNNIGQAQTILEFTAKENGSRDGYPFEIKTLRFTLTGTADGSDLRFILEGPGSNNTVGTISGNVVTFTDFGNIIVTDGDATGKTYQLKGQIRSAINGTTTDGQTIAVSFDPQKDVDVVEASSNIQPNVAAFTSGAMSIIITATELQGKSSFTSLTPTSGNDFAGIQSIYATDVNGRVDTDFTSAITLSAHVTICPNAAPGSLASGETLTKNAVAGVASWTDLKYTLSGATAETIRIRAVSVGVTDACSAQVTVNP